MPLPNPIDWPLDNSASALLERFVGDALAAQPAYEGGYMPPGAREDMALQAGASRLVRMLLATAMDVAVNGYVLGTADGDGEGGAWVYMLRDLIDERLYPTGRLPEPEPLPRSKAERLRGKHKISAQLRGRVMQRDGDQCQTCGSTDELQIDHIMPISKGGSSDIENLQVLCRSCNSAKGAKVP